MKITYNWLKDFVEIKLSPSSLAHKLTMAGLEVTAQEERWGDCIFEIEVTPNRPDCLSILGIAREIAAITGAKLKNPAPNLKFKLKNSPDDLKIEIQGKLDCPLYTAKIIKDIKVGQSPDWLKNRLELIGCSSVNNIVDITNYILFTYGEPMHAFDLDRLDGHKILIRRAKNNEKITTIDGQVRILNPEILVIADELQAVAIAGIMGGKDTEVNLSTKHILLEAAAFNPITIRRAKQALGLSSESVYRFERGVDVENVEPASWQTVKLIRELAGGDLLLAKQSVKPKTKTKTINLDVPSVNKILGINIAAVKIRKILASLGLGVKAGAGNKFQVTIPSYRQDLNSEIDLVEEVGRIFGYENIPLTSPMVKPQVGAKDSRDLVSLVKIALVGMGLNEVITYSLIDKELLANFMGKQESEAIEILNPLSKEQEILRPALAPSLVKCVAYNLNQKQGYVNIFEIARVFSGREAEPQEKPVLGIALCGLKPLWFSQGHLQDAAGFLHLKGILDVLFTRLGIDQAKYRFEPKNSGEFQVYIQKDCVGAAKELDKSILDKLDIKNKQVFVAEISLDKLLSCARLSKKFLPLPRYPGISRDISLVVKEDTFLEQIINLITSSAGSLAPEIEIKAEITDYYKGKPIEPGFKGLTISCVYASAKRTLTDAEINPIHSQIIKSLEDKLGARIR